MKSYRHNPWDGYGLMILHSRLEWIKSSDPKIYRIYNKNGDFKCEVSEFYQEEINESYRKGLKVELQNNKKLIRELEVSIKRLEKHIEEHQKGSYTARELAEKLRVNIMTIYRYIKAGKLKAYKIDKEFRIDKKEFNKFLNKVKTK